LPRHFIASASVKFWTWLVTLFTNGGGLWPPDKYRGLLWYCVNLWH
jgi:hypothetical protein